MATYQELVAQRETLDQQIKAARETEVAGAISQIKRLMDAYGITIAEIAPSASSRKGARNKGSVPPKYRDPGTGATWTGRGKPPAWIAGKEREEFLIAH